MDVVTSMLLPQELCYERGEILRLLSFLHQTPPKDFHDQFALELALRAYRTSILLLKTPHRAGKLVGMGVLTTVEEITMRVGYVSDVVVDPEARGNHFGTLIMHKLMARARELKCTHMMLTSRESRTVANILYRRLGFSEVQTNVYRIDLRTWNPSS